MALISRENWLAAEKGLELHRKVEELTAVCKQIGRSSAKNENKHRYSSEEEDVFKDAVNRASELQRDIYVMFDALFDKEKTMNKETTVSIEEKIQSGYYMTKIEIDYSKAEARVPETRRELVLKKREDQRRLNDEFEKDVYDDCWSGAVTKQAKSLFEFCWREQHDEGYRHVHHMFGELAIICQMPKEDVAP